MSKLDDLLDSQSWGYEYAMSDYATSKKQEAEYEDAGKEAIAELKQAIKDLMLELVQDAFDKDLSTKQLIDNIKEL